MEPLKKLLDMLPYSAAASFIVEIGRQNDSQKLEDLLINYSDLKPENILLDWFSWAKSRQGSDYWHAIYKSIEDRQL